MPSFKDSGVRALYLPGGRIVIHMSKISDLASTFMCMAQMTQRNAISGHLMRSDVVILAWPQRE